MVDYYFYNEENMYIYISSYSSWKQFVELIHILYGDERKVFNLYLSVCIFVYCKILTFKIRLEIALVYSLLFFSVPTILRMEIEPLIASITIKIESYIHIYIPPSC
jgi:hypothetical protein